MRIVSRLPLVLATTGLLLAACGSSAATAAKSSSSGTSGNGAPGSPFGRGRNFSPPAADGEISAVSNNTMTVTGSSGTSTTVNWTSSTTMTDTKTMPASSITPGTCISVIQFPTSNTLTPNAKLLSLTITSTSGTCTPQGRDFPGAKKSSGGSGGFPGGGAGFGFSPVVGKVKSVTSTAVVIDETSTSKVKTIAITSSTTATEREKGSSTDLVQGQCALVEGAASSSGAVSASSISISAPVNGACSSFGEFGGRNFPGSEPSTGSPGQATASA